MAETKSKQKDQKSVAVQPRQRKIGRKQKKKAAKSKKLPSGPKILTSALKHLWQFKRLYLGIFVVYLVAYIILVRGLGLNFELSDTKSLIQETLGTEISKTETAASLFGVLLGSAGAVTSEAAGIYQFFLFILLSLVIIWSLRATFENKGKFTVKQAFYNSTSQLIPYLLVIFVLLLQSLPALIGLLLYSTVMYNGLAFGAIEQIGWLTVLISGFIISIYFLISSMFATYIVTLPGALPKNSLRSARKLVKFRRLMLIRKVIFLPIVIIAFLIAVFLPLVFLAPLAAEILFMLINLFGLFVVHAYLYTLYRELL